MNTASRQASPAVVLRDVARVYNGRVTAVDHVSFEIPRGAWTVGLGAIAAWRWRQESAAA